MSVEAMMTVTWNKIDKSAGWTLGAAHILNLVLLGVDAMKGAAEESPFFVESWEI